MNNRINLFFFFHDFPTPDIYTLSLHDALPIWFVFEARVVAVLPLFTVCVSVELVLGDRKSTRLNSSHVAISYAVFCLKKKKTSIDACCISTLSQFSMLGFHKQMDHRI